MELNTYFYNETNERIASIPGMISVFKGMVIKTKDGNFTVRDVQINLNNRSDIDGEELGVQAFCDVA